MVAVLLSAVLACGTIVNTFSLILHFATLSLLDVQLNAPSPSVVIVTVLFVTYVNVPLVDA